MRVVTAYLLLWAISRQRLCCTLIIKPWTVLTQGLGVSVAVQDDVAFPFSCAPRIVSSVSSNRSTKRSCGDVRLLPNFYTHLAEFEAG